MNLVYFIPSVLGLLTWFIMLSKNKYDNILKLAAVFIASVGTFSKSFFPDTDIIFYLMTAFVLSISGFLLERTSHFRKSLFYLNEFKGVKRYTYEELSKIEVGVEFESVGNLTNHIGYKNGLFLTAITSFKESSISEKYLTDFDALFTVMNGTIKVHVFNEIQTLKEGDTYKMPSYTPRKLEGEKGTVINITCLKPDR